MSDITENQEVASALDELQQYLSDRVAPLMVMDSIATLVNQSPEIVASAVHSWATIQSRIDRGSAFSDFLYHAMVKIHMMQEYKLLPPEVFRPFLERLKPAILAYCPPEDRPLLKANMDSLGAGSQGGAPTQVEVIFRPTTSQSQQPETRMHESTGSIKKSDVQRFSLLMKRLEKRIAGMGPTPDNEPQSREELVSEALVEAARSATETVGINKLLEHLKSLGIQAGPDDVFGALGKNLPGWFLQSKAGVEVPEDSNLQAMHRMISKARDNREAADRFHYLVKAGVERFNEGSLAQSASIFGLARKIMEAKEVDPGTAELVRARTHESLDAEKLKKFAETPDQQLLFQNILNFFPAFTPQSLFDSLRSESKRDRRRLLLALLECHGEQTRSAALDILKVPMGQNVGEDEVYFRRNLLYLLRRIAPSPGENTEAVVELILQHAELGFPSIIVKEALACLAQIKHERASLALINLLQQAESALTDLSKTPYDRKELLPLLDRIVGALCRVGTHFARAAVIEHALKKKSQLGNTMSRLTEFSQQDLSDDQVTVGRLLGMLKQNLPLKRFGIVFPARDQNAAAIVEALSGTPLQAVRNELQDLASNYPEMEAGITAAKVLAKRDVPATAGKRPEPQGSPSLSGDLDLFGLPALLQSLSDSALTGTLKLKRPDGEVFATLHMEKGELSFCRYGNLSSEAAFYQLFEKPQPGTFEFMRNVETSNEQKSQLGAVLPMMLEAMRRYDEVQQLRVTIPDQANLRTKGIQPSPLPEEKDGLLFRELWTLINKGNTPVQCESSISMDSYRILRLIAHWVETGALEIA
jgi:hypothetical protein